MLCARKYVQLPKHAAAQSILRQHALHRKLDRALRVLIKELAKRDRRDAADVARVVVINIIRKLSAGDADLLGVYDNDVIAHIHMRAIVRLMLTPVSYTHLTLPTN